MNYEKIDRLVAERVMEWTYELCNVVNHTPIGYRDPLTNSIYFEWSPSRNVGDAWQVVERLSHMDPQIMQYGEDDGTWTWRVDFAGTNDSEDQEPLTHCDIALAISIAALRAKGLEVPSDE